MSDYFEIGKKLYEKRDYSKAFEFLEKARDIEDIRVYYLLGLFYEKGIIVEQSYIKAAEYFLKGAEAGDTDSMVAIGISYKRGEGVEKSYQKSEYWLLKARDLGSIIAERALEELWGIR